MVTLAEPALKTDSQSALESVAWAALEKVAQKEKQNDQIPDGSQHSVNLSVSGDVDGKAFECQFRSILSVGHRQKRSSSFNPQVPELIACILGKLNRATRNRILSDLPDDFASNGNCIPASSEILISEVEHMLQRLRRTTTVEARGAVRCEYSL